MSTAYHDNQNTIFLVGFSLLTVFSGIRLFSSMQLPGSRRVITWFNTLIFCAALLRVFFFLIPFVYYFIFFHHDPQTDFYRDTVYGHLSSADRTSPALRTKALVTISEILLAAGNWSLYGVFVLIACYWAYMLKKLHGSREGDEELSIGVTPSGDLYSTSVLNRNHFISSWTQRYDSIELFQRVMAVMVVLQLVIVVWYVLRGVVADLWLGDALILSGCAAIVLLCITYLSGMINQALQTMEFTNRSAAQAQVQRIYSIMLIANLFFYTRVLLEGLLGFYLCYLIYEKNAYDILVREPYWTIYIAIKHSTEIVVLVLELVVSTAIKSYENPKISVRHVPKVFRPGFASYYPSHGNAHERKNGSADESTPILGEHRVYG